MLAASLSRNAFEKAIDVGPDEVLPVASPVGYPAEKRSVREALMRKSLKADESKNFDALYFNGTFDTPLMPDQAGVFAQALELARWAPSAGNQQPWRAVLTGNTVHFYEQHSIKENALGDIQKVDVGIVLAHVDLAMRENGTLGTFMFTDPGLPVPEKVEYLVSYEVAR